MRTAAKDYGAWALAVLGAATLAACGGGGGKAKTTTTTSVALAPTSTTAAPGTLTITPPQGPVSTQFSLSLSGGKPNEPVTFEIDFPTGKKFTGPAHTASAEGAISVPYRVTSGNPPGTYTVHATGTMGTNASATFEVTGGAGGTGGTGSTGGAGGTATTSKTGATTATTARSTTTTAARSSTTTAKPASTTSTTKP